MKTPMPPKSDPLIALPPNAYALANIMAVFVSHDYDIHGYDIGGLEAEDFPTSAIPDHGIPNPTTIDNVIWN
jgi:hypothetical protein